MHVSSIAATLRRRLLPLASLLAAILFLLAPTPKAQAASSVLTYTGLLLTSTSPITPANGKYDLQFQLYNAASGGSQVGSTAYLAGVNVVNGVYYVQVDFGSVFSGSTYWLQINYRQTGTSAFTVPTYRPLAPNSANANFATLAGGTQGLQGHFVSPNVPTNGQVLSFSTSSNEWLPTTLSGGGTAYTAGAGLTLTGNRFSVAVPLTLSASNSNSILTVTNSGNGDAIDASSGGNAVTGTSSSGDGVSGSSTSYNGVEGDSINYYGVYGSSNGSVGVYGYSNGSGTSGLGVYGSNGISGDTGFLGGVDPQHNVPDGVYGKDTGKGNGVFGFSSGGTGTGVSGVSDGGIGVSGVSASGVGILGSSTGSDGVQGNSAHAASSGVAGVNTVAGGMGVYGINRSTGVYGFLGGTDPAYSAAVGVFGSNTTSSGNAVLGIGTNSTGVAGNSTGGIGVYGSSAKNDGVQGSSASSTHSGVTGLNSGGGNGVLGQSSSGYGVSGQSSTGYAVSATVTNTFGTAVVAFNEGSGCQGALGDSFGDGVYGAAPAGQTAIRCDGLLMVNGHASVQVLQIVGGSDVAEPYTVGASAGVAPKPGLVVSIDPDHAGQMTVSRRAYDHAVAGILSGAGGVQAGLTLRQAGTVADGTLPVACSGRVWCYCDADANGAITPGDLLTTSNTPGHAMKAGDDHPLRGAILGKAMSSLKSGKGLVLVLVTLE